MTDLVTEYDRLADVLYVATNRNGPAIGREGDDGIIWRYLDSDGTIVGMTVMDFDSYWRSHLSELASQLSARFHIAPKQAKRFLEHLDV